MAEIQEVHKEIDLIQDIIKRMADNSFKIKAWMMAITGAVLAFAKDYVFPDNEIKYNEIAGLWISIFLVLSVLIFWYLDAFFLKTERLYRSLYKWIIKYRPITDNYLYDLNAFNRIVNNEQIDLKKESDSIICVMFSKTLLPFYFLPIAFFLILLICHLI
jgi:hypothetical protein